VRQVKNKGHDQIFLVDCSAVILDCLALWRDISGTFLMIQ
jgi:hypothetical protein